MRTHRHLTIMHEGLRKQHVHECAHIPTQMCTELRDSSELGRPHIVCDQKNYQIGGKNKTRELYGLRAKNEVSDEATLAAALHAKPDLPATHEHGSPT